MDIDNLKLSRWGLPDGVLKSYEKRGITHMFPWQLECLSIGSVLQGENLVYTAPTSAGKTLVAEILIAQTIFDRRKKALVILPFVSVVREKMFYFQDLLSSNGIRVEGYMGGHTPSATYQQAHLGVCTIEKANGLINRMLEEKTLSKLGIVVVDELHLLGDPYRGYLLELLLTKLKYMSTISKEIKLQIVGMSATLPNLWILAKWLDAKLYCTNFRPIPLSEHLKCGRTIFNNKLEQVCEINIEENEAGDDSEGVGHLCVETIRHGHSVLIFCPTKVWCESLSVKIAAYFRKLGSSPSALNENTDGWFLRKELEFCKLIEVLEHLKSCPVGLDKELAKTVPYGVAFHHAGLTLDERDIVEGSFRNGSLRVLCATSTLSSGVNLPARRVIIRSPMSFGGVMDILTYNQMIGRAGRMGVDTEGESILICKPTERSICQQLMCGKLKPVESCLGSGHLSASLKRAILEVVASGVANTPSQLSDYTGSTFLACSSKGDLKDPLTSCLKFLEEYEFIHLQEGEVYIPTPLGQACLASSLPPDEGLALFRELERARRCFVLDSDLHIIYQVTPYSVSEQWSKIDWLRVLNMLEEMSPSMRRVADLVGVEDAFLVKVVKGSVNMSLPQQRNKLSIHRRFYTALALQDLVHEVPLSEVAKKFDCNKGTLQSLQQSSATYAGMVAEFARKLKWNTIELIVSQFQERLQFGVQHELCELMRLPSLNGVRARTLFSAGFTTLSEIANSDASAIEVALLTSNPFESRGQMAGETAYEYVQRTRLKEIWVTGRTGLTFREAAETLIKEARTLLELELGVEVVWNGDGNMSKSEPERDVSIVQGDVSSGKCDKTVSHVPKSCMKNDEISKDKSTNSIDLSIVEERNKTEPESDAAEGNVLQLNQSQFDIETQISLNIAIESPIKEPEEENIENLVLDSRCDWDASGIMNKEVEERGLSPQRLKENNIQMKTNDSLTISNCFAKEKKNDSLKANNRLSMDLFEASPKTFSTPTPLGKVLATSTNSPDLFSQSLTFDTQLEQVCDSEKQFPNNLSNPGSPQKSDDLGFFSDSSPVIIAEISTLNQIPLDTVGESFFAKDCQPYRVLKRKASPDLIFGSDDSLTEDTNAMRRATKKLKKQNSKSFCRKVEVVTLNDSDEEEALAKSPEKNAAFIPASLESNTLSNTNQDGNKMNEGASFNKTIEKATENTLANERIWESFDIVDVCGNSAVFELFCQELMKEPIVGVTLACKKMTSQKKISIGGNMLTKQSKEYDEKTEINEENDSNCLILDGIAFYWSGKEVFYVSMTNGVVSQSDRIALLRNLQDPIKTLRIFNLMEQLKALNTLTGVNMEGNFEKMLRSANGVNKISKISFSRAAISANKDPKVAAWLLSSTENEPSFGSMLMEFLPEGIKLAELMGHVHGFCSFGLSTDLETDARMRACCEVILVYHLMNKQLSILSRNGLIEVFNNVEMPTQRVLVEMELTGFRIDEETLINTKETLKGHLNTLERKAHTLARRKFRISSYADVSKVLYFELRLGKNGGRSKKKPSTSKEALKLLSIETKHCLPEIIIQWRKVNAILTKVIFPLLQILPKNRLHGSCQTYTVNGRISMREPNMQNIPRDFEVFSEVDSNSSICLRDIFVATEEWVLLSADYCQIELRLLAHLSADQSLITHIVETSDIFKSIASTIFKLNEEQVTAVQRQRAKQTSYGIIYGIGGRALGQQLEIDEDVAQTLMDDFKSKYIGIRSFLEKTWNECEFKGYIETIAKRRRYIPNIISDVPALRSEAQRQAVNSKVQGSAADLVKTAMVNFRMKCQHLPHIKENVRLVLHLHDELIYEVKTHLLNTVATLLKDCMENAWSLSVPFPVKLRCGPTWGSLQPLN